MVINTTILGKTAHASTPSEGISAINIAAKAISRMKLGQIDDYTTANIGKFHGGSATNIVADEVVLKLRHAHMIIKVLNNKLFI